MLHSRCCSLALPGLLSLALLGSPIAPSSVALAAGAPGTLENPIIDSAMTEAEAFEGLDPNCPDEIRRRQMVLEVFYYSNDGKIHQGQLVLDRELARDIREAFAAALKERFPITSVIPISHPRFRKDGRWDDDLSMAANNTSAFNYRVITGGKKLSNHAYGRAIDINPATNPYIKGTIVLPPGATYDPDAKGAITSDSAVATTLVELGWDWGGSWRDRKDYQHFEKPLGR